MGLKRQLSAIFTAVCLICAIPAGVEADAKEADTKLLTGTTQTQQPKVQDKSFNEDKNITIREKETFKETKEYIWISYQAKSDGCLTIQIENTGDIPANGYLALYNKTKSAALSSKSISYNGKYYGQGAGAEYWTKSVFGLKKGETYYIRVKAFTPVTLKSSFKKVTDKSGALQTKALNVKKNKKKTGLISAGLATPDWYKIKLKKAQKINLYYNIHTKGSFRISFYYGKKMLASKVLSSQGSQKMVIAVQKINKKGKRVNRALKKGTYYIKLEAANSITSGYYTFRWK